MSGDWNVSLSDLNASGQTASQAEAIDEAKRVFDRALAPKKIKLVPPKDNRS